MPYSPKVLLLYTGIGFKVNRTKGFTCNFLTLRQNFKESRMKKLFVVFEVFFALQSAAGGCSFTDNYDGTVRDRSTAALRDNGILNFMLLKASF